MLSSAQQTRRLLPGAVQARMHLVRYAGFAAAAITINIFSQNTALLIVGGYWFSIFIAILFGNAAGLVFKYICDKHWVFEDPEELSAAKDSRKFALYAFFGVFTTLLFWGVELAFHYIFRTQFMTLAGGVIGLCIGYVIKYNLDKGVTFKVRA